MSKNDKKNPTPVHQDDVNTGARNGTSAEFDKRYPPTITDKNGVVLRRMIFGVTGRPYPMLKIDEKIIDGKTVPVRQWSVMEDDDKPTIIYSDKPEAEVMGQLYRNMPKPSMLKFFIDGLNKRLPDSMNRIEFVKGYPGAGKTFLAGVHASLRTTKKPFFVDCGGKNLHDLLWETVLDFDSDKGFFEELEIKAAAGELNPVSKSLLQNAMGEGYLEDAETGRVVFLWDRIGNADSINGREEGYEGDHTDYNDHPEYMKRVQTALEAVRRLEGLDQGGQNALGLKMVPGPIYQAFTEDCPIILDEYNKSKEGTDDCMQTILQFFRGEGPGEITIQSPLKNEGKGGKSYTLKRKDMGPNFFVTAAGNAVVDGVTTRELSESANQRWNPYTIAKSTEDDWLHAWTQFATGVPISTLFKTGYKNGVNQWDADPEAFREFLYNRRTDGLSDEDIAMIPDESFDFIKNWKHFFTDCKKLASFCHKWSFMLDPDNVDLIGVDDARVMEEIDEPEYRKEVAMGYRKIITWLEKVRHNFASSKPLSQSDGYDIGRYDTPPSLVQGEIEPTSLNYGTRLNEIIIQEILDHTFGRGKMATYEQLMTWAREHGLADNELNEGRKNTNHRFGRGFNISPLNGYNISSKADVIQKLLADHIRETMPTHKDKSDNALVPKSQIISLITHLDTLDTRDLKPANDDEESLTKTFNNHAQDLIFLNPSKRTFIRQPLVSGQSLDATPREDEDGNLIDTTPDVNDNDLIDEKSFLSTLVMPVIGQINMGALWNNGLSDSGLLAIHDDDKSVKMAENTGGKIAITTVMVQDEDGLESPVHIVRSRETGKTLVIGTIDDKTLSRNFMLARHNYVSRKDPHAERKIRDGLLKVAGKQSDDLNKSLKLAFLMRNQSVFGLGAEENRSLEELLVNDDIECFNKNYLVKKGGSLLQKRAI